MCLHTSLFKVNFRSDYHINHICLSLFNTAIITFLLLFLETVSSQIHGGAEMLLKRESAAVSSMHESFSSKSVHMESTMQESSFSSSAMAEMKFETMSMSSMSSMTSESVYAMSTSSIMSSHSHAEGTSIRGTLLSAEGKNRFFGQE